MKKAIAIAAIIGAAYYTATDAQETEQCWKMSSDTGTMSLFIYRPCTFMGSTAGGVGQLHVGSKQLKEYCAVYDRTTRSFYMHPLPDTSVKPTLSSISIDKFEYSMDCTWKEKE